jgi:hypothetical protein
MDLVRNLKIYRWVFVRFGKRVDGSVDGWMMAKRAAKARF